MQAANSSAVRATRPPATHNDYVSLDDFNRRFVEGCRKFDLKATAAMWADDGVDLLPGMEPMVGKTAIQKWLIGVADQVKERRFSNAISNGNLLRSPAMSHMNGEPIPRL